MVGLPGLFGRWERTTPLMSGPPGCSIDATAMTRSSAKRAWSFSCRCANVSWTNAQIVPGEIVPDVGSGDGLIAAKVGSTRTFGRTVPAAHLDGR
jgi:hypothetical protein